MRKGISLIVLSITILVMAILAATAIIALEDSGIIGRSKNTVSKQNYNEEYTRLQVIKNGILTDNLGKITVDAYITELTNKGIIESGVITNADQSKTVTTKSGFNVTISQNGENDINIVFDGITNNNNNNNNNPTTPEDEEPPITAYDAGTFVFAANGIATLYKNDGSTATYTGWKTEEYYYSEVPWYSEMANITNVIFEEGAIPNYTTYWFYGATNLVSVILPEGITKVGGHTFETCKKLQKVVIPNSVIEIGDYSLAYCNFTSIGEIGSGCDIEISSNVKTFGESIFLRCEKLNNVTIPEGWGIIPFEMFYGCTSLTSIGGRNSTADLKIASTVKTIDGSAFYFAEGLKDVEIPSNVTTIAGSAFENAENMENLTFNTGIVSIGNYAFSGCYLKSIIYKGTTTNWNKVTKGTYWYDYNSPLVEASSVVCTG